LEAIDLGFDCEIDLWKMGRILFLGHDKPQYQISEKYLFENATKLWIHCKNLSALEYVVKTKEQLNGFWHQEDDFTLTTKGYIWTYPNRKTCSLSILVHLDLWHEDQLEPQLAGVCSDYFISGID
jgi:hypothetical protein